MELPIEKQFQIMDALRRGFSIREISQLFNVPKSTVQNYKKHGPPYFRRHKKILSIEQYPASLQEENEFLKKAIQEVFRQAKQTIDLCNTANKKVADLAVIKSLNESEIEKQKKEKEQLQTTVDDEKEKQVKMEQDHKRELEEQKTMIEEKKNLEILDLKKEFLKTQQEQESKLTDTQETLRRETKVKELIKKKCEKIEFDHWILQHRQKNSGFKHGINAMVSFSVGTLFGYYGVPYLQNILFPQKSKSRKNIVYPVTPIQMVAGIPADAPHMHSEVTLYNNTSGSLCSGSYSYSYGETYDTGCNAMSNQQDDVVHSDIYGIDSMTLKPNTSHIPCSGAYTDNYGENTCSGYAFQQDGVIHIDIPNEVTIETNISGSQCLGVYVSSHLETSGFTPQTIPIQEPSSPQMTPTYFILPNYPNEFSYSYLMQQLDGMDGIPFEDWIKGFLETQYPSVKKTQQSHDFGTDLIAERPGEKVVIQTKRWKDVVRERAVQEIISGKLFYEADRAIVITSSNFTPDAKKLAKKIGVELWDRERLLNELKKWGYFRLPE
jgi:hypothetical protein